MEESPSPFEVPPHIPKQRPLHPMYRTGKLVRCYNLTRPMVSAIVRLCWAGVKRSPSFRF